MTDFPHVHPSVKQRMEQEHSSRVEAARNNVAAAESAFGPEHLNVAASLSHLAELHQAAGEFGLAEGPLQRALAIREHSRDSDVSGLVQTLRALANLYEVWGKHDIARRFAQRAAKLEAEWFQATMKPVQSAEPECDARAEFVEDMAGSAPKSMWAQILGGLLLACCLAFKGVSIVLTGRTAIYGRSSWLRGPLLVEGLAATLIGLVWICGALAAHFHFFWRHRNRTLCSYGKAVCLVAGVLLLLAAFAKMLAG